MLDKYNLFNDNLREVWFSTIPYDIKRKQGQYLSNEDLNNLPQYSLLLFDFLNYKPSNQGRAKNQFNYSMFKATAVNDYQDIGMFKDEIILFHFPNELLKRAFNQMRDRPKIEKDKRYNCLITFSRLSRKAMHIHDMKIKEI